jgi:hypothetical protein
VFFMARSPTWLRFLASCIGTTLSAQVPVVVVDDQAGPGVDYTDLTTALLAAPQGAVVLLRDGVYDLPPYDPFGPFGAFGLQLSGRSLHLVGDSKAFVKVHGPLGVLNLGPTQEFTYLNIDALSGAVTFSNCAGWAWVENVIASNDPPTLAPGGTFLHQGPGGMLVNQSQLRAVFPASNGLRLAGASAYLYDTSVDGAFLLQVQFPAIDLAAAFLFKSGGNVNGAVTAAGDTASAFYTVANTVSTPPNFSPPPTVQLPGLARSYKTNTPVRAGQNAILEFEGQPGELAILNVSLQASGVYLPGYTTAAQIATPLALLQPMGIVSATGTLTKSVPTSPTLAGGGAVLLYTQASFADFSTQTVRLGGGSLMVVLDPIY